MAEQKHTTPEKQKNIFTIFIQGVGNFFLGIQNSLIRGAQISVMTSASFFFVLIGISGFLHLTGTTQHPVYQDFHTNVMNTIPLASGLVLGTLDSSSIDVGSILGSVGMDELPQIQVLEDLMKETSCLEFSDGCNIWKMDKGVVGLPTDFNLSCSTEDTEPSCVTCYRGYELEDGICINIR